MNSLLRKILGVVLASIGLLGLLLPILPGWLFIIAGLTILSADVAFIDRAMKKAEARFPWFGKIAERIRKNLSDQPPSRK
ncbi:MAG: PGPGW domain-containing protein [Syntrophobacteraceae bacterium]